MSNNVNIEARQARQNASICAQKSEEARNRAEMHYAWLTEEARVEIAVQCILQRVSAVCESYYSVAKEHNDPELYPTIEETLSGFELCSMFSVDSSSVIECDVGESRISVDTKYVYQMPDDNLVDKILEALRRSPTLVGLPAITNVHNQYKDGRQTVNSIRFAKIDK